MCVRKREPEVADTFGDTGLGQLSLTSAEVQPETCGDDEESGLLNQTVMAMSMNFQCESCHYTLYTRDDDEIILD